MEKLYIIQFDMSILIYYAGFDPVKIAVPSAPLLGQKYITED
jgi:hypothetical protein